MQRLLLLWIGFLCANASPKIAEVIESTELDWVFVLPELKGDVTTFMADIYQILVLVQLEIAEKMSPAEIIERIRANGETNFDKQIGRRIAVVQLGNVNDFRGDEFEECYNILFSLEAIFGWRVFPLYGETEAYLGLITKILKPSVVQIHHKIKEKFRYAVHIKQLGGVEDEVVGPSASSMVITTRAVRYLSLEDFQGAFMQGARKEKIDQLWSGKHSDICQSVLRGLIQPLKAARMIIPSDSQDHMCGSRLLRVAPGGPIAIKMGSKLTVSTLKPTPSVLWPIRPRSMQDESEFDLSSFDHVIVIPDIHGDFSAFVRSLWLAYSSLSPGEVSWADFLSVIHASDPLPAIPKRVALVQLGDVSDRGPYTTYCYSLLMKIEKLFGWKLIALYGNHELLNFHGRAHRYLHTSDKLQYDERKHEFSVDGSLWKKISSKLVMAARFFDKDGGGILFVHGGLDLSWMKDFRNLIESTSSGGSAITSLNEFARYSFTQAPDLSYIFNEDSSPVWTRVLDEEEESALCDNIIGPILSELKVDMIFVGHNPQYSGEVRMRCGGKVWLADTCISRWMSSGTPNPTALILTIKGGKLSTVEELHKGNDEYKVNTKKIFPLNVVSAPLIVRV